MDNGGEFTSGESITFRDDVRIRREYPAPDTLQQNAEVENTFWGVMKAGHAARRGAPRLVPGAGFGDTPHLHGGLDRL